MVRIIVCVKQVPDTNQVKIDPDKGILIRDGVPSILNPDDAIALEAALAIKDAQPKTQVVALSMGPRQAEYMLRECLAMGADHAYLLSDPAFGGADTCATSSTLAAGVRHLGGADLILAGRQAIDGDTAQVGPQLAQRLGLPVITYVSQLIIENGLITAERQTSSGTEVVEARIPCVLTVVKELNQPRYMTVQGIVEAFEQDIPCLTHEDLGLSEEECGLKASPTQVLRSFTPPKKEAGVLLSGLAEESAAALVDGLRHKHILQGRRP